MNEIVKVENIAMKYQSPNDEIKALKNVSFRVEAGEFVSIVGPSGCGKSTLLSIIAGLIKPSRGSVFIEDVSVEKPSIKIGYMLQNDQLFDWRTIMQNVTIGLEIQKCKTKENVAYLKELLNTYGLYEFRNKYPKQLSGGMRQRVALIRTLATKPEILLLDEPFSALDYQTRLAVSDDIYSIIKKEKKTTIMVTHDIAESISMSDRIIVMTARPSKIKEIHTIVFTEEFDSPIARRKNPVFQAYFNKIWKELEIHV